MCRIGSSNGFQLTCFSDCIMMYILSYLDSTSLYNLSKTCTYFKNIVEDKNLWKYMDCRDDPNTDDKVVYCCERLNEKTTHAFFKAHSKKMGVVPKTCFVKIKDYDSLTVIALENQKFCGEDISMRVFPKNLEELSLRKTQIRSGERFFQFSSTRMAKLRVLIVDNCNWIDSSFLISIAKYPNLEILSIVKCNKLHHNVMPYLSVARHGFYKLKVLDARFNTIGNDFIREFNTKRSVLALYFQSMRSHHIDTGTPLMRNTMLNLSRNELDLMAQNIISNYSVYNYKNVVGENSGPLPESVLYSDPYPECTCKFSTFHEEMKTDVPERLMVVDDFLDFHNNTPQRFICKRHINEVHRLPTEFCDFFMQNQRLFQGGDGSDENSEDEHDNDCCMYGMGRAQQMIVLKVRNFDGDNQPQAEVYEFAPAENQIVAQQNAVPTHQLITVDLFGQGNAERNLDQPIEQPMPSTSRGEPRSSETTKEKRKCEENDDSDNKKLKTGHNSSFTSFTGSDMSATSTSELNTSSSIDDNNVESIIGATVSDLAPSTSNDNGSVSKRKPKECLQNDNKKPKPEEAVPSTSKSEDSPTPSTSTPPLTDYEKKMLQDIPHIKTIQQLIEPSACIEASFYNYNGKKCINRVYSQEALKAVFKETGNDSNTTDESTTEGSSKVDDDSSTPQEDLEGSQPSTSKSNEDNKPSTSNTDSEKDTNESKSQPSSLGNELQEDVEVPAANAEVQNVPAANPEVQNIIEDFIDMNNEEQNEAMEIELGNLGANRIKLKRLSLRGYRKITDKALRYLRHLNLQLLDLTYTNVTVKGIETFLSYNPDCRIIHKNFCICKPNLLV